MAKIDLSTIKTTTSITGELLVSAASVRSTRAGKDYVDMTLTDGRSNINAKRWDCKDAPNAGSILTVKATVSEYAGQLQLTLDKAEVNYTADITQFAPTRGYDTEAAWIYLMEILKQLTPQVHAFVKELCVDCKDEWMRSTAAKAMHHVQAGGLVQHTAETTLFTEQLCEAPLEYKNHAGKELPLVNKSLALGGAMLHDVGKLATYTTNEAAQFIMTNDGRMMEHIVMGVHMILSSEAAKAYPRTAQLLAHIVSSHHGQLELGSPVMPIMPEAIIVNKADELSAQLDMLTKAYEDAPVEADYTPKLYGLGREFIMPTALQAYMDADLNDFIASLDEEEGVEYVE